MMVRLMEALLKESIELAMRIVSDHALLVGRDNVDEATFRSFIIAEIIRREPKAKCQTEWRRFDLLVQVNSDAALIEIKFYLGIRRSLLLDGTLGKWKGGPGARTNEREFRQCMVKLHNTSCPGFRTNSSCSYTVVERLTRGAQIRTTKAIQT